MFIGIYGESKSGKTTLVARLIRTLREKGLRVGSVKNIHIEDFTIDTQGKDTWEHSNAGAEVVVARSKGETAYLANRGMDPGDVKDIMSRISYLDVVIVEGFWDDESPKVAVGEIEERPNTVMRYKDNFDELLDFIIEGVEVERVEAKLPGLDCGKCGTETCIELARAIHGNRNNFKDCYYFSEMGVSLKVDGKEVPLGRFAREIITGTVSGMVSTLKGVGNGEEGEVIEMVVKRKGQQKGGDREEEEDGTEGDKMTFSDKYL